MGSGSFPGTHLLAVHLLLVKIVIGCCFLLQIVVNIMLAVAMNIITCMMKDPASMPLHPPPLLYRPRRSVHLGQSRYRGAKSIQWGEGGGDGYE